MNKRTLVFFGALFLACAASLDAATPLVILQNLKGKVEVRLAGTRTWITAVEGQELRLSSTLSTGFDASVVIVMGKTTVQVHPLTRLTIDRLLEEGGTLKTTSFLRVGSVSASVKSADGVKQDFKIQSPFTVASVRGTEFDYDGLHLYVRQGIVVFIPGRPTREVSISNIPEQSDDFVGSPDVASDETKAVPILPGQSATFVPLAPGLKIISSNDPQVLISKSNPPAPTPPPRQPPPATPSPQPITVQGSVQ
jgi:hypothetical protein